MMFRSCNTISEYFFSDYVAIVIAILRLVKQFSRVKISCYLHECLYNKKEYLAA